MKTKQEIIDEMEVDFRSETSEIIMTFTDRVHLSASTKTGRVECFIDKKLRCTWDDVSLRWLDNIINTAASIASEMREF